jgi:dihydrodipicolinate reductase
MRILLVGHGRMGRLVGDLAPEYGCEVAGVIDPQSPLHDGGPELDRWRGVDVAIDFTFPGAVKTNVPALARHGINIVIGTTGWLADEPVVRGAVAAAGIGVVVAPNFSAGVVLFEAITRRRRMRLPARRCCSPAPWRLLASRGRSTSRPRAPASFQAPIPSASTARPKRSC